MDILLWFFILLPALMLLEAKRSIRHYILSGKLFFGEAHERRLKTRTLVFLSLWLLSLPLSCIAFILIIVRWWS